MVVTGALPIIRPALPRDAALLPEIERQAGEVFRSLPDLAWIADDEVMSAEAHLRLILAESCWVFEEGSGLAGFLSAERFGKELHIWQVAVLPSRQRQGIGCRLIGMATNFARAAGLDALTLTTFGDVGWNAPLYAQLGFELLPEDLVGPRLRECLAREAAHGLPPDRRCAMRFDLRRR